MLLHPTRQWTPDLAQRDHLVVRHGLGSIGTNRQTQGPRSQPHVEHCPQSGPLSWCVCARIERWENTDAASEMNNRSGLRSCSRSHSLGTAVPVTKKRLAQRDPSAFGPGPFQTTRPSRPRNDAPDTANELVLQPSYNNASHTCVASCTQATTLVLAHIVIFRDTSHLVCVRLVVLSSCHCSLPFCAPHTCSVVFVKVGISARQGGWSLPENVRGIQGAPIPVYRKRLESTIFDQRGQPAFALHTQLSTDQTFRNQVCGSSCDCLTGGSER